MVKTEQPGFGNNNQNQPPRVAELLDYQIAEAK